MEKQIVRTRIRVEPEYWKKFKQECIAEEKNYMDKLGQVVKKAVEDEKIREGDRYGKRDKQKD